MKITEQNWKKELLRGIKQYDDSQSMGNFIETFIKSLITSVKEEERDRIIKLVEESNEKVNKYLKSLTEEDGKGTDGR